MKKSLLVLMMVMVAAMTFAAPVAASPSEAVNAATCAQWHLVQVGDTLLIVAVRYGTTMSNLVALNNIANINRIFYGTYLCVRAASASGFYYVVQSGDTLAKIGARYGWSVSYLASVNRIPNINIIYVGQSLYIPNR